MRCCVGKGLIPSTKVMESLSWSPLTVKLHTGLFGHVCGHQVH